MGTGLTLLLAGLGSSGCATVAPIPPRLLTGTDSKRWEKSQWTIGPWQVGQAFNYRILNGYNLEPITNLSMRVIGNGRSLEDIAQPNSKAVKEVYSDQGFVQQEVIFGVDHVFESPCPLINADGGTFETRYKVPNDERRLRWAQRVNNRGFATVQVPAGQFDTLVFERQIQFEHPDLFRRYSKRVDRIWYSPQLKTWVRREWQGRFAEADEFPGRRGSQNWREENRQILELTSYDGAPVSTVKS